MQINTKKPGIQNQGHNYTSASIFEIYNRVNSNNDHSPTQKWKYELKSNAAATGLLDRHVPLSSIALSPKMTK
jgi:hypothetical protein